MLLELPLVLPAQRPASPEIAESPTLTIHGAPTPGPSACAATAPVPIVAPTNPNNIAPRASLRFIGSPVFSPAGRAGAEGSLTRELPWFKHLAATVELRARSL